jgi:hypothetical protein
MNVFNQWLALQIVYRHFDPRDDWMDKYFAACNFCIHHLPVDYTGGRVMPGVIAEKS